MPIVIACAVGLWFFFSALPFTLLPTGDSGTIRGTFIVPEGASPQQQREIQDKLDPDPSGQSGGRQIFHRRRQRPRRLCRHFHRPVPERRQRRTSADRGGRGDSYGARSAAFPAFSRRLIRRPFCRSTSAARAALSAATATSSAASTPTKFTPRPISSAKSCAVTKGSPPRRARTCSATHPTSTSRSTATAPASTAFPPPKSRACFAPPTRRITST